MKIILEIPDERIQIYHKLIKDYEFGSGDIARKCEEARQKTVQDDKTFSEAWRKIIDKLNKGEPISSEESKHCMELEHIKEQSNTKFKNLSELEHNHKSNDIRDKAGIILSKSVDNIIKTIVKDSLEDKILCMINHAMHPRAWF